MPVRLDLMDICDGRTERIRTAIADGADLNLPLGSHGTALHYAVSYDREDVVDLLLQSGADVNSRDEEGLTPLMQSIIPGTLMRPNPRVLQRLLAAGADLDARDRRGRTALILAVAVGDDSRANLVIEAGTSVAEKLRNRPTVTQFMEFLIAAGADIQATDLDGNNALTYAVWRERKDLVNLLRKAGCAERRMEEVALIQAARKGDAAEVDRLLQSGADANGGGPGSKRTALMEAAYQGHVEVVQALLKAGADVNARDDSGEVALMNAAFGGHLDIVKSLVEAGADPSYSNQGYSVLLKAQMGDRGRGHREVVSYLKRANKERGRGGRHKDKRGVESFEINSDFVLVKAPIAQAAEAFAALHPAGIWKRDAFDQQVELREPSYAVFQLEGHPWTLICPLTIESPVAGHAETLSAALHCRAMYFAASDTAGAFSYRLYENGTLAESFDFDGNGLRFSSQIRDVSANQIVDWQKFMDEFLRQQDAYIPGFHYRLSRGGKRKVRLSLPDCVRDDLVRMDYVGA